MVMFHVGGLFPAHRPHSIRPNQASVSAKASPNTPSQVAARRARTAARRQRATRSAGGGRRWPLRRHLRLSSWPSCRIAFLRCARCSRPRWPPCALPGLPVGRGARSPIQQAPLSLLQVCLTLIRGQRDCVPSCCFVGACPLQPIDALRRARCSPPRWQPCAGGQAGVELSMAGSLVCRRARAAPVVR